MLSMLNPTFYAVAISVSAPWLSAGTLVETALDWPLRSLQKQNIRKIIERIKTTPPTTTPAIPPSVKIASLGLLVLATVGTGVGTRVGSTEGFEVGPAEGCEVGGEEGEEVGN